MSDRSPMSDPTICADSNSAISSQASLFGATVCDSPAGPTTESAGREAAPAQVSRVQVKAKGLMMLVTSGRNYFASPASVALQHSLENSLRTRLDTAGGTLYPLIWKVRHTPLRRRFLHRQALVRRTSGTDSTLSGWPTPQTHDVTTRGNTEADCHYSPHDLSNAAMLAGWPTPRQEDGECCGAHHGRPDTLKAATMLAGWRTPTVCSPNSMRGKGQDPEKRKAQGHTVNLQDEVRLAGWPTPTATDAIKQGEVSPRAGCMGLSETVSSLRNISQPMRLKATGELLIGSSAQMDGGGPLKPEHSRWIQGLPAVWDDCGVTAIASMRKLRKRSSKVARRGS
jgi:hypothetical protein